ncbi:44030_t:CDS:1, partial [Gigaspora margarita]
IGNKKNRDKAFIYYQSVEINDASGIFSVGYYCDEKIRHSSIFKNPQ